MPPTDPFATSALDGRLQYLITINLQAPMRDKICSPARRIGQPLGSDPSAEAGGYTAWNGAASIYVAALSPILAGTP